MYVYVSYIFTFEYQIDGSEIRRQRAEDHGEGEGEEFVDHVPGGRRQGDKNGNGNGLYIYVWYVSWEVLCEFMGI